MKSWLPAMALGVLMAVIALSAVLAIWPATRPTDAERSDALARGLRCPDCQGLSVADSPTSSAQEIRRQVDELVSGGASDEQVRDHFVARYGEWILLAPRSPALWVVPFAGVLVGVLALGVWLARARRKPAAPPMALAADERRRLHDEVDALDA